MSSDEKGKGRRWNDAISKSIRWMKKSKSGGKKDASPKRTKPSGANVIGMSLEDATDFLSPDEDILIPPIVAKCVEYIEESGALDEVGLYRLSGSTLTIQALRDQFVTSQWNNINFSDIHDPHAVTGLLKLFFREMPRPLLSREVSETLLGQVSKEQKVFSEEELDEIYHILSTMCEPIYFRTLGCMMMHLSNVVSHQEINKMTLNNLIIIFSPCLQINPMILTALITNSAAIFEKVYNDDVISSSIANESLQSSREFNVPEPSFKKPEPELEIASSEETKTRNISNRKRNPNKVIDSIEIITELISKSKGSPNVSNSKRRSLGKSTLGKDFTTALQNMVIDKERSSTSAPASKSVSRSGSSRHRKSSYDEPAFENLDLQMTSGSDLDIFNNPKYEVRE